MSVPTVQTLEIPGWLPAAHFNRANAGNWRAAHTAKKAAQKKAADYAFAARWLPLTVKAKLTIVLVFDTNRRRDTDNLYARVKGLVDGVKRYIIDDDTEHLELIVTAAVEAKKAVRMTLEPAS